MSMVSLQKSVGPLPTNTKTPYITIDLSKRNGKFTNEDVEVYKNIMDWKTIFPEVFGVDLPPALTFVGFGLGDNSTVDFETQRFRDGGGTKSDSSTKLDRLASSIGRNGWKLKYAAPCWFDWGALKPPNGWKSRVVITGNGRGSVLKNRLGMENCIVGFFVPTEGYTPEQVADALEECGGKFNTIHDPHEPISKNTVKELVSASIERYQKTNGEAGIPNTPEAILDKVNRICGQGVFTTNTRYGIAQEVDNNYNPHRRVIPWTNVKTGTYVLVDYLRNRYKFIDTDKVKYMYVSFSTVSQAWHKAVELSVKYPKAEIRVVPHTGTLEGSCYHTVYKERIKNFINKFNNLTKNALEAFNTSGPDSSGNKKVQNPLKNKITVYAAFPAVGEFQNIEAPIFINGDRAYQKLSDNPKDYSFSINDIDILSFIDVDESTEE